MAAAVQAACLAHAPQRTVAAVAAAVASTVLRPVAATPAPPIPRAAVPETSDGQDTTDELVQRLRQSRADRRKLKRQRRRDKKSAAPPASKEHEGTETLRAATGDGTERKDDEPHETDDAPLLDEEVKPSPSQTLSAQEQIPDGGESRGRPMERIETTDHERDTTVDSKLSEFSQLVREGEKFRAQAEQRAAQDPTASGAPKGHKDYAAPAKADCKRCWCQGPRRR